MLCRVNDLVRYTAGLFLFTLLFCIEGEDQYGRWRLSSSSRHISVGRAWSACVLRLFFT